MLHTMNASLNSSSDTSLLVSTRNGEKILFTVGSAILIIVTLFGNTLVVMAFYMCRSLKTYTNYFIVSLSLSDILVALISMPVWITLTLLDFDKELELLKRAWTCFDIMAGVASIWNLTAVSVDRYVHVTKPLTHSKLITRNRVLSVIIIIWIFSGAISLLKGVYYDWAKPNYEMLVTCLGFFVPLIFILFCYLQIYRVVRKHLQKFKEQTKCLHNQKRLKTDVKAIKMIAIVVMAVFICWGPFFVLNIFHGWCIFYKSKKECILNKNLISFAKWLHYANSAINPIIYACFNRDFRNGFKIALYKRLSTNEKGPFTNIINRTSIRETLNSVHDNISPNGSDRSRSKTFDNAHQQQNGTINKRHSIPPDNAINVGKMYQTQVVRKISATERSQLLTPRISV